MKKIKDVTSLVDGTASFELSLSHDDIPVRWMFKGVELKTSARCKMVKERKAHRLILQNVDVSDSGEYSAVLGHLQCTATLTVEGNYTFTAHLEILFTKKLFLLKCVIISIVIA